METLVVTLKSKKDVKLVKELAARLNADIKSPESKKKKLPKGNFHTAIEQPISREHLRNSTSEKSTTESKKKLSKGKFESEEDFMRFAGSMKGLLISKEHLRNLSWKRRSW